MQELGDWAHWRASGLVWEKTEEGWRRVQGPMDTQPEGALTSKVSSVKAQKKYRRDLIGCTQPFVFVSRTVSKQVVIESTSITQVLDKLDFMGAVKDIRRFRYVCNFLEMLIREKFPQLSGMAQKKVMLLLEAILDQAIESEKDLHLVCSMVRVTQQSLMDGIYRHMGGKRLWSQHFERVHRMQQYLQDFELTERQDDGLTLTDLPDDVLREILLRLPDHTDLLSMSEVDKRLQEVSNDEEIWKELTLFHFGECMNASHILKANKDGWKSSYRILSSQFTPRVEYPEQLCICSHCNAMFWELHGHPCLESKAQSEEAPQEFTLSPKGRSIYGKTFADESFVLRHQSAGWVAMANYGRDSNGSQFYVLLTRARWLDGKHVVFGKVINGYDFLVELGDVEVNDRYVPRQKVTITDCGVAGLEETYGFPPTLMNKSDDLVR